MNNKSTLRTGTGKSLAGAGGGCRGLRGPGEGRCVAQPGAPLRGPGCQGTARLLPQRSGWHRPWISPTPAVFEEHKCTKISSCT